MSWWAYLQDDAGLAVKVSRHAEGGTYVLGGVTRAELNVTYNYGARFREAIPEVHGRDILVRLIDKKTGRESASILERIVAYCGAERNCDYWEATPGNAGHAASIMLAWANEHPDARWEVR